MKRNTIHALLMAALLPLAILSCTRESLPGTPDTGDVRPLSITVTDGGYGAADGQTKAVENAYRTEFTAGDKVGLYIVRGGTVVYNNVKLTATSGADGSLTWQPEASVALAGGFPDECCFLYYPYQSDMSGKTTVSSTDAEGFFAPLVSGWQPKADQSTYANYTASDLMTAKGTATKGTDGSLKLSFSMSHRMALAVIEMPPTVYKFTNATSIPDYTVASSADFTSSAVKPYGIAPGTYRCIFNPASGTAAIITGSYADGKKEFAVSPESIAGGSCKTYRIDGGRPIEKGHDLQLGDYFCKDGSGNWYVISGAEPGSECIGIVFYAGHHPNDASDYSDTGIGQKNCRGYAVALTDVHDGSSDRLRWEWGPKQESNLMVNASTSTSDWQGYSNSLKFHEFVNKNENREAGWEMKHFPAALACETYGNRMLDKDGNDANGKYDWQKPLAAPGNTSGWFLPSFGQLQYLYQNRYVLSARMTEVKNSTPTDCGYKEYIKWFSTSLFYWSSTESSGNPDRAWYMDFEYSSTSSSNKRYTDDVRAVLAF